MDYFQQIIGMPTQSEIDALRTEADAKEEKRADVIKVFGFSISAATLMLIVLVAFIIKKNMKA